MEDNVKKPRDGVLYYRGYSLVDVIKMNGSSYSYEKTCFLLLFGHYPNNEEISEFNKILKSLYKLPDSFIDNIILKKPSKSLMNHITRAILSLYSFDDNPDDINPFSLIKKGLSLIAKLPAIISYSYQAKSHYIDGDSLNIRFPKEEYSLPEKILY